jgi:regulator of protease activity HflC (stomatin/prohibitin superfamily)
MPTSALPAVLLVLLFLLLLIVMGAFYQVMPDKVYEAFYKLADPNAQIQSYVFNVILGHVPKLNLDEAFLQQSDIATAVKNELDVIMADFGYNITRALVTDIKPRRCRARASPTSARRSFPACRNRSSCFRRACRAPARRTS